MKLYTNRTAPNPRRVRIFAAEKGIDYEPVEIDLRNGEQFRDGYRIVNPDCVVPTLETDAGEYISEVNAICHYLEALHPEPTLYGDTPLARARTFEWNAKIEQQGLLAMADAFRNSVEGLAGHAVTGPVEYAQIPELAERVRRRVPVFMERLDRQLAGREFVTGGRYTFADISALVFVDFAGWFKIGIPDGAPNLRRWHDAVSARASARA